MVLVGLYLALLVLIIVGFGMLVGKGVVMGLPLVRGRVLLVPFWVSFCSCFSYPPRSSGALLAGTLPLRYCSAMFACRVPCWTLPIPGHVAGLVVSDLAARVGEAEVAERGVHFVCDSDLGRKRIRFDRKTPAHLVGLNMHARPRVWKRLHGSGYIGVSGVDCKRRRCNQHDMGNSPVHPRTGVG